MLAHGFSTDMMAELVNAGLETATSERSAAGNYRSETTCVRITEAGQRMLT